MPKADLQEHVRGQLLQHAQQVTNQAMQARQAAVRDHLEAYARSLLERARAS